jgi:hypothetical protein
MRGIAVCRARVSTRPFDALRLLAVGFVLEGFGPVPNSCLGAHIHRHFGSPFAACSWPRNQETTMHHARQRSAVDNTGFA